MNAANKDTEFNALVEIVCTSDTEESMSISSTVSTEHHRKHLNSSLSHHSNWSQNTTRIGKQTRSTRMQAPHSATMSVKNSSPAALPAHPLILILILVD